MNLHDSGGAPERGAPPDTAHDRRQRRMLIAIALFFFAPLGVAFVLYYGSGGWRPGHRVNRGDLIDPARPLPEIALPLARAGGFTKPDLLKNKWTLLYWGGGACTARCRTDLYNTRQVRIALNRDMDRVQRVFVADGACCDWTFLDREHPDLVTVQASAQARAELGSLLTIDGIAPAAADRVYLIDPLGNLMMSYAPDAKPKGMLEDLKRLLGLSQVG
jgi:cytochrome oxidase Cu insertion factor (SCO1/SenC/PrrC family)